MILLMFLRLLMKKDALKKNNNIITYGINYLGTCGVHNMKQGFKPGMHAEHDAIRKLRHLRKKNHLQKISILVIRINKNKKIQASKPCYDCIQLMNKLPQELGYKIQNVYYSTNNGDIIKTNLNKLSRENVHLSKYRRILVKRQNKE